MQLDTGQILTQVSQWSSIASGVSIVAKSHKNNFTVLWILSYPSLLVQNLY